MPDNVNKARNSERAAEAVKDFAQQNAAFGKDFNEQSKALVEEANKSFQQTYSTVAKGAFDFNLQWIEMLQANTNSSFDFARQLVGVKSPSEFLELSTTHARKQFETLTQQAQRLADLAQKVTTDAVQPLQASVKSVNKAA